MRLMGIENNSEVRTVRLEQACARYNLGKSTMRKVAKEAEAVVKIGKCYLINTAVVDAYMDKLAQ